ncbi:hypothetical protein J2Y60_002218 [Arcicella sp. BE140]|nr:hypothetical protein [Arcicella sp. BE51]MDR6812019.1 hypothetical protein [Arcicella sp. BE140]MDR6823330.1 hypothetical protein [Arcicella sp. BE139]
MTYSDNFTFLTFLNTQINVGNLLRTISLYYLAKIIIPYNSPTTT